MGHVVCYLVYCVFMRPRREASGISLVNTTTKILKPQSRSRSLVFLIKIDVFAKT